jgi:hypothetical protein
MEGRRAAAPCEPARQRRQAHDMANLPTLSADDERLATKQRWQAADKRH